MARLLSMGAELNSATNGVELRQWSGASVTSVTPRSGTYAILLDAANDFVRGYFATSDQADGIYVRSYWMFTSFPVSLTEFINVETLGSTDQISIRINSTGTLELWNDEDNAQVGSDSSALSLDTWYRIEVKVDTTTLSSTAVDAQIDGVSFASGTINLATGIAQIQLLDLANAFTARVDDVAVNNDSGSFQNSFPGSGKIIHLRPNAGGDNTDWTNTFANVDEVTPDDATTFISSNTLDQISDFNIDPASPIDSDDTVNVVQVGVRFNGAGASANASFVLRIKASSGGTVEESGNITPSNTTWDTNTDTLEFTVYSLTLYDLPGASTTAWTASDLDTAQIGVRLSAASTNAAQVSTLWLLADYTEGVAPTPSPATVGYRSLLGVGI